VDWSEASLWDPAVDIAQFAISNLPSQFRRQHEAELLQVLDGRAAPQQQPQQKKRKRRKKKTEVEREKRYTK
jgi:hypothetical protein